MDELASKIMKARLQGTRKLGRSTTNEDDDYCNEFCNRCDSIVIPIGNDHWRFEHGPVGDILRNARHGCPFCVVICSGFKNFRSLSTSSSWMGLLLQLKMHIKEEETFLKAVVVKGEEQIRLMTVVFKVSADPYAPESPISLSHQALTQSVNLYRESTDACRWLSKCTQEHDCGAVNEVQLPSRIIDVTGSDPNQLQLHISKESSIQRGSYVALSYCWGTSTAFTTTATTLESRIEGFRLSDLPLSLRDAVLVTRKLGCRYLWIDALCILQGFDEEAQKDWQHESSLMDSVYNNALVTIVAAAASSSDEGFFHPRQCYLPSKMTSRDGQQNEGIAKVMVDREAIEHKSEPINSRAWALQERLLSKRLLIYGSGEIAWQCDECIKREVVPGAKLPKWQKWHAIYKYRLPKPPLRPDWKLIVENYCSRNLTNDKDKLPAIAGLARHFHSATEGRYLAGLWESSLLSDLLWVRYDDFKTFYAHATQGTPSYYRAPSWSWASMDGIVSYIFGRNSTSWVPKSPTKIIRCTTEAGTPDVFGSVKNGELVIEGPIKEASRIGLRDDKDGDKTPSIFAVERESGREFRLGNVWLDGEDGKAIREATERGAVYCLLLKAPSYDYNYGLVLSPLPEKSEYYSRMGVFVIVDEALRNSWFLDVDNKRVTVV